MKKDSGSQTQKSIQAAKKLLAARKQELECSLRLLQLDIKDLKDTIKIIENEVIYNVRLQEKRSEQLEGARMSLLAADTWFQKVQQTPHRHFLTVNSEQFDMESLTTGEGELMALRQPAVLANCGMMLMYHHKYTLQEPVGKIIFALEDIPLGGSWSTPLANTLSRYSNSFATFRFENKEGKQEKRVVPIVSVKCGGILQLPDSIIFDIFFLLDFHDRLSCRATCLSFCTIIDAAFKKPEKKKEGKNKEKETEQERQNKKRNGKEPRHTNTTTKRNVFEKLPMELCLHIMKYLKARDLVIFSFSSFSVWKLIEENSHPLWKQLFLDRFQESLSVMINLSKFRHLSWKARYLANDYCLKLSTWNVAYKQAAEEALSTLLRAYNDHNCWRNLNFLEYKLFQRIHRNRSQLSARSAHFLHEFFHEFSVPNKVVNLHVLFIGEAGIGKSSLLMQFVHKQCVSNHRLDLDRYEEQAKKSVTIKVPNITKEITCNLSMHTLSRLPNYNDLYGVAVAVICYDMSTDMVFCNCLCLCYCFFKVLTSLLLKC